MTTFTLFFELCWAGLTTFVGMPAFEGGLDLKCTAEQALDIAGDG